MSNIGIQSYLQHTFEIVFKMFNFRKLDEEKPL